MEGLVISLAIIVGIIYIVLYFMIILRIADAAESYTDLSRGFIWMLSLFFTPILSMFLVIACKKPGKTDNTLIDTIKNSSRALETHEREAAANLRRLGDSVSDISSRLSAIEIRSSRSAAPETLVMNPSPAGIQNPYYLALSEFYSGSSSLEALAKKYNIDETVFRSML